MSSEYLLDITLISYCTFPSYEHDNTVFAAATLFFLLYAHRHETFRHYFLNKAAASLLSRVAPFLSSSRHGTRSVALEIEQLLVTFYRATACEWAIPTLLQLGCCDHDLVGVIGCVSLMSWVSVEA